MSLKIRVIETQLRGEISPVKPENPGEAITKALKAGKKIITAGDHSVISLFASSPHTTGEHDVWWLNTPNQENDIHWDDQSESNLVQNKGLWHQMQQRVVTIQNESSIPTRAYMYWGFSLPEWQGNDKRAVIWRGLQSQQRWHMHVSQQIPDKLAHDWVDLSLDENKQHLARFLNFAGENMLSMVPGISWLLTHGGENGGKIGEQFVYPQPLPADWPQGEYARTLIAFPDLATAIEKTAKVRIALQSHWLSLAQALHEHSPLSFASQLLSVFQSSVPNFAFILPSLQDMNTARRSGSIGGEVWVAPCTVIGAPEMLSYDGLQLRRVGFKS